MGALYDRGTEVIKCDKVLVMGESVCYNQLRVRSGMAG